MLGLTQHDGANLTRLETLLRLLEYDWPKCPGARDILGPLYEVLGNFNYLVH
jgi:hypothetical protein